MVLPQAMAWVQYWFRVLSLKFCGKSKKKCGDISPQSPAFCMYGHRYSQAGIFWCALNVSLRAYSAQLGCSTAHVKGKSWIESVWLSHTIYGFLQQYFSISATTLQYFATSFLHFCNTFHVHWGSKELLWCKKRNVTDVGPQLTSFGAKMSRDGHVAST